VRRRVTAMLALTVLAACGGGGDGSSPVPATATAEGVGATAPEVLRFSAPIVGGGELDGSTLAGRPAAFWFWAPT
jgi:ABC-type glycerol-3-phosphate transport system substrate-binding protein